MATVKTLPVPNSMKNLARETAYARRESMSRFIAGIIDDIATGAVTIEEPPAPLMESEIKYRAPESYDQALAAAQRMGVPLAEVIRREITRRA